MDKMVEISRNTLMSWLYQNSSYIYANVWVDLYKLGMQVFTLTDWLKYICWVQNSSGLIDLCEVSSCVNSSAYFSVLKMVMESHSKWIKNTANHGNVLEYSICYEKPNLHT